MDLGRQFHSLGPAMLNDLSVNVILLVKGAQRNVLLHEDHRCGLEIVDLSSNNSDKHEGA